MTPWRTRLFLDALDERIVPDATPVVTFADGHTSGAVVATFDSGSSSGSDVIIYPDGHTSGAVVASYDNGMGNNSYMPGGNADSTTVTTLVAAQGGPEGVSLTVTVTGSLGHLLTGSVYFYDNGVMVGMTTVGGGGVATWAVVNPAAGVHVLTAAYSSNVPSDGSESNAVSVTVPPGVVNTSGPGFGGGGMGNNSYVTGTAPVASFDFGGGTGTGNNAYGNSTTTYVSIPSTDGQPRGSITPKNFQPDPLPRPKRFVPAPEPIPVTPLPQYVGPDGVKQPARTLSDLEMAKIGQLQEAIDDLEVALTVWQNGRISLYMERVGLLKEFPLDRDALETNRKEIDNASAEIYMLQRKINEMFNAIDTINEAAKQGYPKNSKMPPAGVEDKNKIGTADGKLVDIKESLKDMYPVVDPDADPYPLRPGLLS